MAAKTITLEIPETILSSLDSREDIAERAWKALVLDLLRDARISQGRAAELLGVTHYDILDLMAEYRILSGPSTPEEARRDVEAARRGMRPLASDAGGQ